MTNEAIIRRLAEKEKMAKEEGVRSIIIDLRRLLHNLKICKMPTSYFDSMKYVYTYSPIFKKTKT